MFGTLLVKKILWLMIRNDVGDVLENVPIQVKDGIPFIDCPLK